MKNNQFDFIIVGGGIVGMATAYKLQLKFPKKNIAVLEKESKIGSHQTGRNSGVIHSGIYYKPGSLKALNCKKGRVELVEFAEKHHVNYNICGKIIVATKEQEISILEKIYQNGIKNKTEGIIFLGPSEIEEKEPFVKGLKAIWVPTAGIINYAQVTNKFAEIITEINQNSRVVKSCEVLDITNLNNKISISTNQKTYIGEKIIVCTGLHSDRVARKNKIKLDMQIVGFRGDYYEILDHAKHKVKKLIYPVPDIKYPFLGVHFTPMINGDIECGPNAVFSFKREGYKINSFSLKDSLEALAFKGTWKLFAKNWRKGMEEYRRAFSKKLFVKELQKMIPSITEGDVKSSRSGVRAQAVDGNGNMVDDFKIISNGNITHVLNAPSPAATACLAIADEIIKKSFSFNLDRGEMKMKQGKTCYYK